LDTFGTVGQVGVTRTLSGQRRLNIGQLYAQCLQFVTIRRRFLQLMRDMLTINTSFLSVSIVSFNAAISLSTAGSATFASNSERAIFSSSTQKDKSSARLHTGAQYKIIISPRLPFLLFV
jgi:hypothetical protein